jgi:hypothetical protein
MRSAEPMFFFIIDNLVFDELNEPGNQGKQDCTYQAHE